MSERWQRVGALFDRALETPDADRLSFVRSSNEPPDVQDEVLALLKSHAESDGFLEPAALLEPGAEVGAYRIERIIGRGGMGVVYLAHDTRLHRAVALKALPPHLFRDDRMRARLRQEARAAAALSHPSIATVFALEEIGDQLFIASEYLEGQTLREILDDRPLPETRALEIARAVAAALQAAHDRGIVHRDLKPENIIVTGSGVKIVDFGIAQLDSAAQDLATATRLTEPGVLAGTPHYMAPEQLLGRTTDARTDQYAFGVVLHDMLGNAADRFKTIISRATQRDPADRFASMNQVLVALAENDAHGTPGTLGTPGTVGSLDWWSTHQLVVALGYWFMVYPTWIVHKWTGRYGVLTFLATLAIVIVGGNVRLHLWFTARTYPGELPSQLANIGALVRAADVAFSLIMIAIGLVIADAHTGWAALFVAFGLGAALAFLVIEPATARAAFRTKSEIPNPRSEI
jgi:tRNA A-37 threonylcarbamoyl transferase component Bud32